MKNIDPGGFCGRFFGAIIAWLRAPKFLLRKAPPTTTTTHTTTNATPITTITITTHTIQLQLEVKQPLQLQIQPKQQLRLSFLEKIGSKLNAAKKKDWFRKEMRQNMAITISF
jgi:hypothetical protein